MIALVDSGSANLGSVYKALIRTGSSPVITDEPAKIRDARGVVFPGVGSFEHAARVLKAKKLDRVIVEVVASGKPFLGICLGFQLLMSYSEERSQGLDDIKGEEVGNDSDFPTGLAIIKGAVKKFPAGLPVPHVGWNRAFARKEHPLMDGLPEGCYFYFTHSFFVAPEESDVVLTETEYNGLFASAVALDNLMGVQFHPEKSGPAGLKLLNNFRKIVNGYSDWKLV